MAFSNPQVHKSECKPLLTLDILLLLSTAKNGFKNLSGAMRDKKLTFACCLFALCGGDPESSKVERSQEKCYKERILAQEELAVAVGRPPSCKLSKTSCR